MKRHTKDVRNDVDNKVCNHLMKIKSGISAVEWYIFRNFAIPILKCDGHGSLPSRLEANVLFLLSSFIR